MAVEQHTFTTWSFSATSPRYASADLVSWFSSSSDGGDGSLDFIAWMKKGVHALNASSANALTAAL